MPFRFSIFIAFVMMTTSVYSQQADPQVQFDTTVGSFTVTLDAKAAPKTVANFLSYVEAGFYNGTIFHRVIKGFMIQGGGLNPQMQKKPTQKPVMNEAHNGLQNLNGTIAMARTGNPHSATAQFFINVADNSFLDHKGKTNQGWGYCVFGRVTKGMQVVSSIEKVETAIRMGRKDVPVKSIEIKSATLVTPKKP